MADSTISGLPYGGTPGTADFVPVAKLVSPGVYTTVKTTVSQIVSGALPSLGDLYVNVSGDTMTGNLVMVNAAPAVDASWTITVTEDATMGVIGSTYNQILTLNPGTASAGNTGQTITGRFRYAMPVLTENTAAVLGSGSLGVTTGLVRTSSATPVTHSIRANTASFEDFDVGNFFSVMQEGAGQVTLIGEDASVELKIPTGYIAATRAQYSVISATLYEIGEGQVWVISGDLAEAP